MSALRLTNLVSAFPLLLQVPDSRSPHLSQVGMGVRNWSEYNVVSFLIIILQTQAVLLLVCTQSPEVKGVIVNCKGSNVPSVPALKSPEYRPECFLPLQTSCATLLPASIAQVLVTSRLAPHFTTTPSQQGGSLMKYRMSVN